jgi:four helix bundle protein
MSRDPNKLRVFHLADALVLDIYRCTKGFPPEERFGLQSQTRRAAVSSAANIVEGCARKSKGEYLNFLNVSAGSACEMAYLLSVAHRLGLLSDDDQKDLGPRSALLAKSLIALISSLSPRVGGKRTPEEPRDAPQSPKPKA